MNTAIGPERHGLGPRARLRTLGSRDRDAWTGHLLRLSRADRYRRFGGHVSDARIRDYVESKRWRATHVLGAWLGGELRGVAEIEVMPGLWPPEAEIALSVEASCQRRGIGRRLFRQLLVVARNRFVQRVHVTTQHDNVAVQRIAASLGLHLHPENGHLVGQRRLAWPTWFSLMDETMQESWSMYRDMLAGLLRSHDTARAEARGPARNSAPGCPGR